MEFIGQFLILFVVFFALYMVIFVIGLARSKAKRGKYQAYILQQFPHLQGQDFLMAKQLSKKLNPTIALIIDQTKNNLILLFETAGKGFTHLQYPSKSLRAVARTTQILSRGFFPKTFSYEETLALNFEDGKTYPFVIETISNKYGNDKGATLVKGILDPWEQKLKGFMPEVVIPPLPK